MALPFVTSGAIGLDLKSNTTTQGFTLGDIQDMTGGGYAMYVYFQTAAAQYDAVGIDGTYNANPLTKALLDAGNSVGFAQIASATGEYGWVPVAGRGTMSVNVLNTTAAGNPLYTTATAGKLSDVTTSQSLVSGVVTTVTNSSGGTAAEPAIATYARGR